MYMQETQLPFKYNVNYFKYLLESKLKIYVKYLQREYSREM